MPMGGMMSGPNSQGSGKGSHNSNMTANMQHNLLLQQGLTNSQLGNKVIEFLDCAIIAESLLLLGQMPQGYSPSTSHNLHNVPPLHHYDMDGYQNL